VGEIPEKSEPNLLLKEGKMLNYYVFCTWPYQTQFDNYFGRFISWMMLRHSYATVDIRVVSALLVISTILLGFCLLLLETYLRLFRSTTISKAFKETMWPKLKSIKEYTVSKFRNMRGRSGAQELVESTSSSIVPRSSTVDAAAYREPLLDLVALPDHIHQHR